MKNYIVNKNTIAVIGIDNNNSKIIEINRTFIIGEYVKNIIDDSCIYYGSSYNGRVEASISLLENSYKVPILIEKTNNIVFFPTISPTSEFCIWISINEIESKRLDNGNVILLLKNGEEIKTNLSRYSIENQMFKSYQLYSVMKSRIS